MKSQRKIALCGLFAALAAAISFAESISGIDNLIPVPGVKLGLSNIAILGAVLFIGKKYGFAVLVIRCAVTFLVFGNVSGFIISLAGGLFAFASVCVMIGMNGRLCSLVGISAASAFFHASGQLIAAAAVTGSSAVMSLSPVVLSCSVFTGVLSGMCANAVYGAVKKVFPGGAAA